MLYDGGAHPSTVSTDGALTTAGSNLSGTATTAIANAKNKVPFAKYISQEQHEVKPDKLTDSCKKLMPTESFASAREAFSHYVKIMQGDDDKACIEAAANVMKSSFKPSRTEMMRIVQELAPKASSYPPGDYALSIVQKVEAAYPNLRDREISEETTLKK